MQQALRTALCVIGLGYESHWIDILRNGQEKTWLMTPRPTNIEVLHVHGRELNRYGKALDLLHEKLRWRSRFSRYLIVVLDVMFLYPLRKWIPDLIKSPKLTLGDSVLQAEMPDFFPMARFKEIAYFNYFLDNSTADFLITTTNSSYLNLRIISKTLQELPTSGLYFGPYPYKNAEFVSGSFRIFSRDVVQLIVENRSKFRVWDLEDVAIGKLLRRLEISPVFVCANNFSTPQEIADNSIQFLKSQMHFRLKSGPYSDRQDVQLMLQIHSRISGED